MPRRDKILYYTDMPDEGWILCLELNKAVLYAPISDMMVNNVISPWRARWW